MKSRPLSQRLARIILPAATTIALVVAIATPATLFFLSRGELATRAQAAADRLADRLRPFVRQNTRLWFYNTGKVTEHLEGDWSFEEPLVIEITDGRGRTVVQQDQSAPPYLWRQHSLTSAGGGLGRVLVGVSLRPLLHRTIRLLLLFALLGGVLAVVLYRVPTTMLRRAEGRLRETLADLAAARESLSQANSLLEERVEEKTRSLQAAHDALAEQRLHLQQLAARLVGAQEEERRRISADLHDSVGQLLTAIRLHLETARHVARDGAAGNLDRLLEQSAELTNQTTDAIRHAIHQMGPPLLRPGRLAEALEGLRSHFAPVNRTLRLDLDLGADPLPAAVESMAFRVVQEALNNAYRHGHPDRIEVAVRKAADTLTLLVEDDGGGEAVRVPGHGLARLADRLLLLGGELAVTNTAAGVRVEARLPIPSDQEEA